MNMLMMILRLGRFTLGHMHPEHPCQLNNQIDAFPLFLVIPGSTVPPQLVMYHVHPVNSSGNAKQMKTVDLAIWSEDLRFPNSSWKFTPKYICHFLVRSQPYNMSPQATFTIYPSIRVHWKLLIPSGGQVERVPGDRHSGKECNQRPPGRVCTNKL